MFRKRAIYEHRFKITGIIAGILLLNLVFWFFFTYPSTRGRERAEEKLKEIQKRKKTVSVKYKKIKQRYEKAVSSGKQIKNFLKNRLSTKKRRMTILQETIRKLGKECGIHISDISYSNTRKEEMNLIKFAISLPMKSSYGKIRKFIHLVENSEQFLIIEGINLKRSSKSGSIISLDIQLSTYFKVTGES